MTVKISKDKINVREKLSELDKPSGIAGEAMLRADTPAEQFELINAGRKNLIINGDMKVWQRGGTYTHDVTDATKPVIAYSTVDRFQSMNHSTGSATAGVYTSEAEMYDNKLWLKHGCTTPYNSSDYIVRGAVYFVEQVGYTLGRPSRFRNKELTLSYLFRAKQNGQYGVTVGGPNDDIFSIFSFDYTGSGETQKVSFTFTFPDEVPTGDTALRLYFNYGVDGPLRMSDDTNLNGVFQEDLPGNEAGITRQSDYPWWQVAGDWIAITEVQLEFGSVATSFEYRSYGEELALCQRYFYATPIMGAGVYNTDTTFFCTPNPPVTFRTTPTITTKSGVLTNINIESSDLYDISSMAISHQPNGINPLVSFGFPARSNAFSGTGYGGIVAMDQNDDEFFFDAEV